MLGLCNESVAINNYNITKNQYTTIKLCNNNEYIKNIGICIKHIKIKWDNFLTDKEYDFLYILFI